MQLIQSFSSTSAAGMTSANPNHSTPKSSAFDHLLSSISKQETETEAVKKKLDEAPTDSEQHVDTSAQADNLLAMLLNTPTTVPTPPNAVQPPVQAPLPAEIEQTRSSNPQALAQNLESQLKVPHKVTVGAPPPTANTTEGTNDLIVESETFILAAPHEPLNEIPSVSPVQTAPAKPLIEAASASNEMRMQSHVSTPLGQQDGDKATSQPITWMLQNQLKSATLTMNPPHLDPVPVHIQLDNLQINVQASLGLPEVGQASQQETKSQAIARWPEVGQALHQETKTQVIARLAEIGQASQQETKTQAIARLPEVGQASQQEIKTQAIARWPEVGQALHQETKTQVIARLAEIGQASQQETKTQAIARLPEVGQALHQETKTQVIARLPEVGQASQQETSTWGVKKKLDETPTYFEQHVDTSAQADNLLAMLLNTPTTVPTPPNTAQPLVPTPLPAEIEQTRPSNLQALAQNLESQLKVPHKDMVSVLLPTASTTEGANDLIVESETFILGASHEPLIEIPSVSPAQIAPGKPLLETASASNELQMQSHVSTPFGQQGWDKAISQRVTWMLQDQLKSATLTVNPPHLGPIQVHIQLDNQQINVQFISGLPEVRQALQDAIPALESLMNQSGLQLGQSDVSDQQKPSKDQSNAAKSQNQISSNEETENNPSQLTKPLKIGSGLLSTFA